MFKEEWRSPGVVDSNDMVSTCIDCVINVRYKTVSKLKS